MLTVLPAPKSTDWSEMSNSVSTLSREGYVKSRGRKRQRNWDNVNGCLYVTANRSVFWIKCHSHYASCQLAQQLSQLLSQSIANVLKMNLCTEKTRHTFWRKWFLWQQDQAKAKEGLYPFWCQFWGGSKRIHKYEYSKHNKILDFKRALN